MSASDSKITWSPPSSRAHVHPASPLHYGSPLFPSPDAHDHPRGRKSSWRERSPRPPSQRRVHESTSHPQTVPCAPVTPCALLTAAGSLMQVPATCSRSCGLPYASRYIWSALLHCSVDRQRRDEDKPHSSTEFRNVKSANYTNRDVGGAAFI
ncbi:hypothetical protein AUEXF2481DRAFT_187643 [Aureobasidium subglaciale EXF-2481]|uniref:Uncharacterized protein n=1 Tax=Aureobasidium subglaciale (strain EXF-2481) TaxID=1043005 RepID=A0A074ZMQ9_AURSE|nr:uncharacterized protein AUEXF2481DRAFT_187643 [Aureobasidium subglaciale EXF-2481]KEQ99631.1 hypothetical protein AUEXF2481DRAFT_187643 [Aureobasidium subglaciale EXF-2481]